MGPTITYTQHPLTREHIITVVISDSDYMLAPINLLRHGLTVSDHLSRLSDLVLAIEQFKEDRTMIEQLMEPNPPTSFDPEPETEEPAIEEDEPELDEIPYDEEPELTQDDQEVDPDLDEIPEQEDPEVPDVETEEEELNNLDMEDEMEDEEQHSDEDR